MSNQIYRYVSTNSFPFYSTVINSAVTFGNSHARKCLHVFVSCFCGCNPHTSSYTLADSTTADGAQRKRY